MKLNLRSGDECGCSNKKVFGRSIAVPLGDLGYLNAIIVVNMSVSANDIFMNVLVIKVL